MKGIKNIYKLATTASELIYPWVCCVCGAQSQLGVCRRCERYLPWCNQQSVCKVCGLPITANKDSVKICGKCQKAPPYYDQIYANFWYQSPIDRLISGYKYFNQWQNAHTLIELSIRSFTQISTTGLVLPMPSHSARIRQRGFNAVYELTKMLSRHMKFDYDLNSVMRIKDTQTQTGKTKSQRRKNVEGAFKVVKPITQDHVIIIDEVVTTAATVNELSRCLKKSGVKGVSVWAIARTK